MNKNKFLILIIVVVIAIFSFYIFKSNKNIVANEKCVDKIFSINATLQSGERGTAYIMDNHCELPVHANQVLAFTILNDGAIQDNLSQTKLYLWLRQSDETTQQQIENIASKQFKKNNECVAKQTEYSSNENIMMYGLETQKTNQPCVLFGPVNDYYSELFMSVNNVIIAQRNDGATGIEPYSEASIHFIQIK